MNDPVTASALTVIVIALLGTLVTLALLYRAMQPGAKRRRPSAPHRKQLWLAALIGIGVPLLLLAYALLLSPASLSPDQLHHRMLQDTPAATHPAVPSGGA